MIWLILLYIIFLIVGLVLLFWQLSSFISLVAGAPYLTSPLTKKDWPKLIEEVKNISKPSKKDSSTFLDLGSGDGTICLYASNYFDYVYGIEISPFNYLLSHWRTRKHKNIKIIFGNILQVEWPKVDLIYCYLLPKFLKKIQPLLIKSKADIICLDFEIQIKDGENRKLLQRVRQIKVGNHQLFYYQPVS